MHNVGVFYLNYLTSTLKSTAVLAQLVERVAFNHVVVGSIPTDGVLFLSTTVFIFWTSSFFNCDV